MLNSTKKLNDGRIITFTKSNPVRTFSAIRRELQKRGFKIYHMNIAMTGSRYLEMYDDELEINVRCSNHTDGYSNGIEIGLDKDGIDSLSINLSQRDIKIADFRRMIEDIKIINQSGYLKGLVDSYNNNGITTKDYLNGAKIPEYLIEPIDEFLKKFAKYL